MRGEVGGVEVDDIGQHRVPPLFAVEGQQFADAAPLAERVEQVFGVVAVIEPGAGRGGVLDRRSQSRRPRRPPGCRAGRRAMSGSVGCGSSRSAGATRQIERKPRPRWWRRVERDLDRVLGQDQRDRAGREPVAAAAAEGCQRWIVHEPARRPANAVVGQESVNGPRHCKRRRSWSRAGRPFRNSPPMSAPKKLYIKTYGCQMNVYDSERMAEAMAPEGYVRTETGGGGGPGPAEHLPHPGEGRREGLFRPWPPEGAEARAAGSADRRRRLRRPGRGRRDPRPGADGRSGGRTAKLSPAARDGGGGAGRRASSTPSFPKRTSSRPSPAGPRRRAARRRS